MFQSDTTIVVAQRQISCELGGEAVLLNLHSGTYYGINAIGARIWASIQSPTKLSDLKEMILSEYDVDEDRCEADLVTVLTKLLSAGLIEVSSTGSPMAASKISGMSRIAGIYHLDGRPVDRATLDNMCTGESPGSGPKCNWIEGAVGFTQATLCIRTERINVSLAFDGRIDNRQELEQQLGAGAILDRDSEAEYVVRAYERWGEDCATRIIGDFAFVLWDAARRRLFCVRDPMGIKPLYYYSDQHTFVFGSEIRQILQSGAVRPEPNEAMIAEYLACSMLDLEQTLYARIMRLPPGHLLVVRPGRLRKIRYFEIDSNRKIRYAADEQYAEHFLDIFREAVRCRLRSRERVGVYLSGGLDSSSVAVLSQQLYERGAAAPNGFETFSILFPDLPCDESKYIDHLRRIPGMNCNTSVWSQFAVSDYREQVVKFQDFPDYPNGMMSKGAATLARKSGFGVLLTGLGGDEWLMGSLYHYADLLGQFRLFDFVRHARSHSSLAESSFSWRTVMRFGIWPLLPQAAQSKLDRHLGRNQVPAWIEPHFAARTNLPDRLRSVKTSQFETFAQRDIHEVWMSGWRIHALEMEARASQAIGIEQRHPLSDRRVAEFALALPEEQRWRGDQTKFVLRQAMRSMLPEPIRQRRSKAEFSPVFVSTFDSNGGCQLFDSLAIASNGWVEQKCVTAKYQHMQNEFGAGNQSYAKHTCPLWMIFGVDLWFRTIFGSHN